MHTVLAFMLIIKYLTNILPISVVKTLEHTLHGHKGIEDDEDDDEVGDDRASGCVSK